MKNNKIKYTFINKTIVWVFALFLSTTTTFAQTDLPDIPDDTGGTGTMPIDTYTLVLAILGVSYVLFRFYKQPKQSNSQKI